MHAHIAKKHVKLCQTRRMYSTVSTGDIDGRLPDGRNYVLAELTDGQSLPAVMEGVPIGGRTRARIIEIVHNIYAI